VFDDTIVDVTYEDKELLGDSPAERNIISDIRCTTKDGRRILLEMQLNNHVNFSDRMTFYASKAIVNQARKGDWDFKLDSVYLISLTNFMLDNEDGRVKVDRCICYTLTGKPVSDVLRFIYIQLPVFTKTSPEECENDFERWIYTLKNLEKMKTIPFAPRDDAFRRLQEVANEAALSEKERRRYEHDQKQYWVITNIERTRYNEGFNAGQAQGMAKIAKMARKMRENGMDDMTISKMTGEPLEWVRSL